MDTRNGPIAPVLVAVAAASVLACAGDGPPSPSGANLFANPGFEEGEAPWVSLDTEAWGTPFAVSQAQAQSGQSSALLELRATDDAVRVFGVVQEVSPDEFPQVLSGAYYVDRWEQGTTKQYLQFVVIVFGAANRPADIPATNHQIRYVLAGVERPPLQIGNARYIMLGRGAPQLGRWVHFERDIRQDFLEEWGAVPEGFAQLRILFEVRWDERSPSDPPAAADVYYDDLYLGPAPAPD